MSFDKGYLYVVDGERWARETLYAIKRMRSLSDYPICIVCSEILTDISYIQNKFENVIVKVVHVMKKTNFCSKVIGMINTPFEKTLYMDTDTFVVSNVDDIFELLDLCDMALKPEPYGHTNLYPVPDKYLNLFSEYNTGICLFNNNKIVMEVLREWQSAIETRKYNQDYFDMPQLRNVLVNRRNRPNILPLHECYNMQGLRTYKIIHGEVKIIHERFGIFWFSHSERMLDNRAMEKIAKRINKTKQKRLFIPYFNVAISAQKISITYLVKRLKTKLGFKKLKKSKAF